jgi:outer membrane lipoprotein SlyB
MCDQGNPNNSDQKAVIPVSSLGLVCPICSFQNAENVSQCEMCGQQFPSMWSCDICTYSNEKDHIHCEACGTMKKRRSIEPPEHDDAKNLLNASVGGAIAGAVLGGMAGLISGEGVRVGALHGATVGGLAGAVTQLDAQNSQRKIVASVSHFDGAVLERQDTDELVEAVFADENTDTDEWEWMDVNAERVREQHARVSAAEEERRQMNEALEIARLADAADEEEEATAAREAVRVARHAEMERSREHFGDLRRVQLESEIALLNAETEARLAHQRDVLRMHETGFVPVPHGPSPIRTKGT